MPGIRYFVLAVATTAFLPPLSGCDKMRSTEPPPSFESPTVGVARDIGGASATPAATPPSPAASGK